MTRLFPVLFFISSFSFGQTTAQHKAIYRKAFEEQKAMLNGKTKLDFKRAVFVMENAFYNNSLNYANFSKQITDIGQIMNKMIVSRGNQKFKTAGNWAAFNFLTDTIPENKNQPYVYDFEDFQGKKEFSKQLVTKLLNTKTGNCHSLPILYKLIANEVGAKAHLALAPNHCFIKHINEQGQWMNVEMTNASFPRDQWLIKSMAVSVDAIRTGAYMRALNPKEEIAFLMGDLALAYFTQFGNDDFVLEALNYAMKYFPNCMELYMNKCNTLGQLVEVEKKKGFPNKEQALKMMKDYKESEKKLNLLGFQDMPKEQYSAWVKFIEKEKIKRGYKPKSTKKP